MLHQKGLFYWFDDLINQEFVDCVDEIDDCQRVICINNLPINITLRKFI